MLEMTRRYTQALGFDDVFKRHVMASPLDRLVKQAILFIIKIHMLLLRYRQFFLGTLSSFHHRKSVLYYII